MRHTSKIILGGSFIIVFIIGGLVYVTLISPDPPVPTANGATNVDTITLYVGQFYYVGYTKPINQKGYSFYTNYIYGGISNGPEVRGEIILWGSNGAGTLHVKRSSTVYIGNTQYKVTQLDNNKITLEEVV